MAKRDVCDFCFKEPTEIDAENGICYYFAIAKENGDATVLMSNGKLRFKLWNAKEHPIENDTLFVCETCFDKHTGAPDANEH